MRDEWINWPQPLVIEPRHAADPEFMKELGGTPYVVRDRMLMVDVGNMMEARLETIKFVEPVRDHPPRPSFRDRFPNDPVRNRRARQHMGRQGSRARGQKS